MYILARIVRLGSAPTSSREPPPHRDGNQNHPTFAASFLLCVLISTGWELVHAGSPLYVNMLLHISLFGQAQGQDCRKHCGHPSSSVKCSPKCYQSLQNCMRIFIQQHRECAVTYY